MTSLCTRSCSHYICACRVCVFVVGRLYKLCWPCIVHESYTTPLAGFLRRKWASGQNRGDAARFNTKNLLASELLFFLARARFCRLIGADPSNQCATHLMPPHLCLCPPHPPYTASQATKLPSSSSSWTISFQQRAARRRRRQQGQAQR